MKLDSYHMITKPLFFFPFSRNVHPTLSQNLCFVNGVIGDGTQKDEHVECSNVLCEAAS